MRTRVLLALVGATLLTACANVDRYLRPESSFYVPSPQGIDTLAVTLVAGVPMKVNCLDKDGKAVTRSEVSGFSGTEIQCLYYSADFRDVSKAFEISSLTSNGETDQLPVKRNHYLSFLLHIADQNCETFLNRAFANKSSLDTTKSTLQDLLTGGSAATAHISPPTAAGLGLTNLVFGKTMDNVNSTFFYEKAFQAIGSAINLERADLREQIASRSLQNYLRYTIYDALTDVRRYEGACSIRVGVGRLQALAEDRAREKSERDKVQQALLGVVAQRQAAEARIGALEETLKGSASKSAEEKAVLVEDLKKVRDEKKKYEEQVAALQAVARANADAAALKANADLAEATKRAEAAVASSPPRSPSREQK